MDSQRELIRKHLVRYGRISPIEALERYGCFRLGGRIMELRRQGMPIVTTRPPDGKRYAIYIYTGEQHD